MRQAHRVPLRAAGARVGPGWVVLGLLGVTLLTTGMVAGSTGGTVAPAARSFDAGRAPVVASEVVGLVVRAAGPARGPVISAPETGPALSSAVEAARGRPATTAAARPAATPKPAAALRPATTARPKAAATATVRPKAAATATVRPKAAATATVRPKATPAPRAAATPKPTPAIVYEHRASGRATWGQFGGAVITRLAPGTRIRVCGRLGCWEGMSAGFGPSPDGGHLVDLDAAIFRRICGPLATGVGSIVLSWR